MRLLHWKPLVFVGVLLSLAGPARADAPVQGAMVGQDEAARLVRVIRAAIVAADAPGSRLSESQRSAAIKAAIESAIAQSGDDPRIVLAALNRLKTLSLSTPARAAVSTIITLVLALMDDKLQPTAIAGAPFLSGGMGLPADFGGLGGADYRFPG